jgi:Leucine-rich repeat (LRR) protein
MHLTKIKTLSVSRNRIVKIEPLLNELISLEVLHIDQNLI